jgi:hypothetical protein
MSDHMMFLLAGAGVASFLVAIFLPPDLPERYWKVASAVSAVVARLRRRPRIEDFSIRE